MDMVKRVDELCVASIGHAKHILDLEERMERLEKKLKAMKGAPAKRFIVPTVQEVADYCKERRNNIKPEDFVNFYEARGWMIGKNKMKNWKAAIRTWETNGFSRGQQKPVYNGKDGKVERY